MSNNNQHTHHYVTCLHSQQNDSNSSGNDKKNKLLQSGYDTIDGYERFLFSKKQLKKNKQKDMSLRRKINANNDFYKENLNFYPPFF